MSIFEAIGKAIAAKTIATKPCRLKAIVSYIAPYRIATFATLLIFPFLSAIEAEAQIIPA
ncbi:MAG: hypothetical protein F6J93_33800 [Oscillatoria sp. SIO1A7]|nr:hypothetical protein [Oscillatoria sp. SIO1A7]